MLACFLEMEIQRTMTEGLTIKTDIYTVHLTAHQNEGLACQHAPFFLLSNQNSLLKEENLPRCLRSI